MLVLGDAHAADPVKRRALLRAYEAAGATHALQAGDLEHYDLPVPTWFIAGNNEDFDVIEALRAGSAPDGVTNAHLLASTVTTVNGVRIAGLSGNFAPSRFDNSRGALKGRRRRHFVREEVEAAKRLDHVDVFLCHEAPHGLALSEAYAVGCSHIDAILEAVEPSLCLLGHHHQHVEGTFGSTRVVSLAPAWESYYRLDPASLRLERHPTPSA